MNQSIIELHLRMLNLHIISKENWKSLHASIKNEKEWLGPFTYGYIDPGSILQCSRMIKVYKKHGVVDRTNGRVGITDLMFKNYYTYINSIEEGINTKIKGPKYFLSNYLTPPVILRDRIDLFTLKNL